MKKGMAFMTAWRFAMYVIDWDGYSMLIKRDGFVLILRAQ